MRAVIDQCVARMKKENKWRRVEIKVKHTDDALSGAVERRAASETNKK